MDQSQPSPEHPNAAPENPGAPDPVSRIQISLDLAPDRQVRITIEALDGQGVGDPSQTVIFTLPGNDAGPLATGQPVANLSLVPATLTRPHAGPGWWFALREQLAAGWSRLWAVARTRGLTLSTALFGLALALYLGTRLSGLQDFPIYFFTDEAVQTVRAADLVRDNFFGYDDVFLPTYFENGPQYNLSLSVYLQVIPYLLFGKSVFVTRAVPVLVTLIAAVAVALILREIFKVPYWWSGTLLLSITPAWFLHSRTAFETAIATSLYAGFLYLYLLYRTRSPHYLYSALVLAGLTFYAYSPAQVYIAGTGILLLVSDARYHWQQRQVILRGLGVAALLAVPYVRFRLTHGEAPLDHLRQLGSYWLQPLPLGDKITRFLGEYLYGLSPGYWYIPNGRDLIRHVMDGYGHILRATLPFALLGLALALRGIRQSANRVVLIALLAAPLGASVVQIGITRLLVFVIPACLLTALGFSQTLTWLERLRAPRWLLAVGLFAGLSIVNLALLRNALTAGPTWFSDYGLGGLQYGARQVFGEIQRHLERSPDTKIVFSPTWANGTNELERFFLPDPLPIETAGIEAYLLEHKPPDPEAVFILPAGDYQLAMDSGKFKPPRIEQILPYPDGRPGFYFLQLTYVDNVEELFAAERAERARLQEAEVILADQPVMARYSRLDMGQISDLFDGNPDSVTRTLEANPAVVELTFPEPRRIQGFSLIIGSSDVEVTARFFERLGTEPTEIVRAYRGTIEQPEITFSLDEPVTARVLRLEVRDTTQLEPGHVHIWELMLR